MTRTRGVMVAMLVAGATGLAACPTSRGGPAPSDPSLSPDPSPGWTGGQGAGEPAAAIAPIEAGFTPCCGTERYRIEIECGEMLKRCYENKGGIWRQTYGRHCKAELGEACYLEDCDAKCQ